jgi:hypothetical protein
MPGTGCLSQPCGPTHTSLPQESEILIRHQLWQPPINTPATIRCVLVLGINPTSISLIPGVPGSTGLGCRIRFSRLLVLCGLGVVGLVPQEREILIRVHLW